MWYTVGQSKISERKKSDMLTRRFFLGGLASYISTTLSMETIVSILLFIGVAAYSLAQ